MNLRTPILKTASWACIAASGWKVAEYASTTFGIAGYALTAACAVAVYYGWETAFNRNASTSPRIAGGVFSIIISLIAGMAIWQGEQLNQQQTINAQYQQALNTHSIEVNKYQTALTAWTNKGEQLKAERNAPLKETRALLIKSLQENTDTQRVTNGRKQPELLKSLMDDQARMQAQLDKLTTRIINADVQRTDAKPTEPVAPIKPQPKQQTAASLQSFAFELLVPVLLFLAGRRDDENKQVTDIQQAANDAVTELKTTIADANAITRTANKAIAGANEAIAPAIEPAMAESTAPDNTLDENQAMALIKKEAMPTDDDGYLTVEIIMDNTGLGRTRAKRVQQTAIDSGHLEGIKRGRGTTARYKEPDMFSSDTTSNIVQLRSA